ncbi:MAG TPA: hypothetical protein VKB24_07345, partial [Candidatus Acidoferrum sp.]|nr:hypothetical protein [Candidatus Acidoferrum sp.]
RDSIEILKQAQELTQKADPAGRDKLEVKILESIGDAHFALGGLLDSAEAYRAAALRAGRSGFRSAQVHALVRAMFPLGAIDPDQGLTAISRAFEMSKSVGDPHLVAYTQMLSTGCHLIFDGWRETEARLYTSAWNTLRDQGDFAFEPLQQMVHGHVLSLFGRYGEALAAFDGCISRVEDPSTSLITSFGALSGKTFALLRSGKLGELLRLTRAGRESFEENRTRWWLLSVREAWMRVTVFDYRGAIEICEPLVAGSDQYRSVQPRAICAMASGCLAMGEKNFAAAAAWFSEVHQPQVKTKYFLHWLWQMAAHFELGGLWLEAEDLARAKAVSASFLESALGTADPYTRSLAWELSGRVALAERNFRLARERIDSALAVLEEYEVPLAAWRVYSTAATIYSSGTGSKRAGHFLARARQAISKVADSFDRDEPLRASFLAAGAVRRACGKPPAARSSPQPA